MRKTLVQLALVGLLVGTTYTVTGCYGYAATSGTMAIHSAPPAPTVDYYDDRDGSIWVEGHWAWYNQTWNWRPGYWIAARPGFVYTQGYWDQRGDRYLWTRGRWVGQRDGQVWARGYWDYRDGRNYWRRGHWSRRRPGHYWHRGRYQDGPDGTRWQQGRWGKTPRVRDHRQRRSRGHRNAPPARRNERVRSHRRN
jgi:hypothetical protein